MDEVIKAKEDIVKAINSIDKDKLSIYDLKVCAETLSIVNGVSAFDYAKTMQEMLKSFENHPVPQPQTIADLK